jgi:adenylylsulfate kinase
MSGGDQVGSGGRGGVVVWLTGAPSSGKSTLATRLGVALAERGRPRCVLDGDRVRAALVPSLGYDAAARDAFYATLANLAALLAEQGLVVVVAATAHARAYRERARRAAPAFVEVFLRVDAAELQRRDAKGLYAAARAGRLHGVPGGDLAYEEPLEPEVTCDGGKDPNALERIFAALEQALSFPGR